MKYMGSKKVMLQNGLGKLLIQMANESNRVFDPFCGSGIVAWFLSENCDKQVIAGDLQEYSIVMANALLMRDRPLTVTEIELLNDWVNSAEEIFISSDYSIVAEPIDQDVLMERVKSGESNDPITKAYGGYYFSFNQAQIIDHLLKALPSEPTLENVALAALIEAASVCVAAPGHTAQPFRPTEKGLLAINEAWKRDPLVYVRRTIADLGRRFAKKIGEAKVSNAIDLLNNLKENDLVFLDPPYSSVHYSRFYHVLETIARKRPVETSGAGRYPPSTERPISDYSKSSTALKATESLLKKIAEAGAKAVFTFPEQQTSNKLSGKLIEQVSKEYFIVEVGSNSTNFSTLGGNCDNRPARKRTKELYIKLLPK